MRADDNSQAPRVLIVRVGAMGDVLHGMPAVAALRAAWPAAYIGWAIEPRWAALLQTSPDATPRTPGMPLVDAVHHAEGKLWAAHPFTFQTARSIRALRRELRDMQYDVAIDLQGSIRSAVIARLSGAHHVVGSATPREPLASMLYSRRVRVTLPHVIEQATEIVSAATKIPGPRHPSFPLDSSAEAWADAVAEQQRGPLVLMAPTAGWGAKQWPAQHFGDLAEQLSDRGFRVLVNASSSSPDPVAEGVVAASRTRAERVPCTLPQLIALMRRVRLAIVGDSGPLHLAAALRVPVVALFGPTDPARNGPYGTRAVVLRHPASVTSYRHVQQPDPGLQRITVQEVLDAALSLLQMGDAMDNG